MRDDPHAPPSEMEEALATLEYYDCSFDVDDTDMINRYHPECIAAASMLRAAGWKDNAKAIRKEIEEEIV